LAQISAVSLDRRKFLFAFIMRQLLLFGGTRSLGLQNRLFLRFSIALEIEVTLVIMKLILGLSESSRTFVDRKRPTHGDFTAKNFRLCSNYRYLLVVSEKIKKIIYRRRYDHRNKKGILRDSHMIFLVLHKTSNSPDRENNSDAADKKDICCRRRFL
jgi:hypothetical protein